MRARIHQALPVVALLAVTALAGAVLLRAWERGARESDGAGGGADERGEATGPRARFAATVVPVLDRRCGSCHGVGAQDFGERVEQAEDEFLLRWRVDGAGRIASAEDLEIAYQRCTGRGAPRPQLAPIDLDEPALASALVRAPLAPALSGRLRAHPEVFTSLDDPDLRAMIDWLEEERAAAGTRTPPVPSPPQRFFAEQVMPILERKTCAGANCHGRMAFNDLHLDPGIPALAEPLTPKLREANRQAMLGTVTRLVALDGDPEQSKQLLKNIPVAAGGIVHKGGNDFFARGDPDYQILVEWLRLEAEELKRATGAPLGEQRGLVFVRRPRDTPERFFESPDYLPGSELVWLRDGVELVLSEGLGGAELDLRAPDVSFDARRVVFAMRRAADQPFDLWELELESRRARQLTFSGDPQHHFMEPLYVPDPDDLEGTDLSRVALVFTSNHLGGSAPTSAEAILGEAEGGTRSVIRDRQLSERAGTYVGRTLRVVAGTNLGEVRRVVAHRSGELAVDRPFALPVDTTTHFAIEVEARRGPRYDAFRMRLAEPGEERATFDATLTRMTASVDQVRRPTMRSDGSPMFTFARTGWQGGRPTFNGALYRCHVDGSDFHPHNGNRSGVPIHSDDRELPNGLEIRIGRDPDSWWGGMPMLSDHQLGITIEPDNPLDLLDHPYSWASAGAGAGSGAGPDASVHRFVPGWIPLDPSVTFKGVSPGGAYRDPYPLPDGSILVARAAGPLDLGDPAAAPDFDLVRLVPEPAFQAADGRSAGRFRVETVVGGPRSELWPRPVLVRRKPPVNKAMKTEVALFGELGRERGFSGYPATTSAVLQVYDYPLLEAFFEQTAPSGPRPLAGELDRATGVVPRERARVELVRVVLAEGQDTAGDGDPVRAILGEFPLAEDGSLHLELPANVGFTLQSLDGDRRALRSSGRWMYLRPGEKHTLAVPRELFPQTCGGCHGSLSGEPEDTFRTPDAMTSASRRETTWDPLRSRRRPPQNYGRVDERLRVTYEADVRPLVEQRCLGCHAETGAGAQPSLAGDSAFAELRARVDPHEPLASRSELVDLLLGVAPSPEADALALAEAHRAALTAEQRTTLIRWIDLGAARGEVASR